MPRDQAPEPWRSFLRELEDLLPEPVALHCFGGFVVTMHYDMPRRTGDIDLLAVVPHGMTRLLQEMAGAGSRLHRTHLVHLQQVGVATVPEDYQVRLAEMFPGEYTRLRLLALDPYDLALSKLERNLAVDREDVKFLARSVPLRPNVLTQRYQQELRPYLTNTARHDLTLRLWLEAAFPVQG